MLFHMAGVHLPIDGVATPTEETELKRMRRKLKNKLSAQVRTKR